MTKRYIYVIDLLLDVRLQCREAISQEAIEDYAEVIKANPDKQWPFREPLEVVCVNGDYYVVDGFTRVHALKAAGRERALCVEVAGTWAEAVQRACRANATQGQRRTRADKRRAVEIALRELEGLSANQIAGVCCVSPKLVAHVRKILGLDAPEKVQGSDGKQYPAKSKAEKKSRPKPSATKPDNQLDQGPRAETCQCGANWWVLTDGGYQCTECLLPYPEETHHGLTATAAAAGTAVEELPQVAPPQAAKAQSISTAPAERVKKAQSALGKLIRACDDLKQADGYFTPTLDKLAKLIAAVPVATEQEAAA